MSTPYSSQWLHEKAEWFLCNVLKPIGLALSFATRLTGPAFIIGFYYLIYLHMDAYLLHVMPILKKRLGLPFSMVWTAVGTIIGFNVLFNHTCAVYIKATGPVDIRHVE